MPSSPVTFDLPYPPSVNHYWRMWRGRMVIGARGRAYRRAVCLALRSAGARPLDGDLCVAIALHPPDRRRRDCDNTLKALCDAVQHGGGYHDDSQIVWLLTIKSDVVSGGMARVHIWRRGEGPPEQQQAESATQWICSNPNPN